MKIASRTNCVNQSMMDDIDGYHHWRYGPLLLGCNLIITYRPHFCINNANSRWKWFEFSIQIELLCFARKKRRKKIAWFDKVWENYFSGYTWLTVVFKLGTYIYVRACMYVCQEQKINDMTVSDWFAVHLLLQKFIELLKA